MTTWPITLEEVDAARARIAPYLPRTPLRGYAVLDEELGARVLIKHENHLPTNAFKVRNAISFMTSLDEAARRRGVVAATRGNHGAGLAWAGQLLGVKVTVCVPVGNNPEKNAAIRGFGAELIESGHDYDSAIEVALRLVSERGMTMAHSTNDRRIIAGAATITAEILEDAPELDAMVIAVGGGSQAVGALVVTAARRPGVRVFGVQAANAAAIHDSWHAGRPLTGYSADTWADGLATRQAYEMTFPSLRAGLAGFVTATEEQLADAVRVMLRVTHNLAEGAGAAGLAGVRLLREELRGKTVAIVLSGGNIDHAALRRAICGGHAHGTRDAAGLMSD